MLYWRALLVHAPCFFFSDKTTLLPDIQLEMVRIHSVPGALEKSEAFVNLGKVTASVDLTHWSITV